ncbi:hypothetical protein G9P44_001567 [Scheffersomyces stipitis]|nr:hypothetical protein G9P44_001567 [Scheffersomyces stipitis]
MKKLATFVINDNYPSNSFEDVQIWSGSDTKESDNLSSVPTSYERMPIYVNYRLVPYYLLSARPLSVFSTSSITSEYFKQTLLKQAVYNRDIGILFKSGRDETYLIFYFDFIKKQIMVLIIDFSRLAEIDAILEKDAVQDPDNTKNTFILLNQTRQDDRSTVFDKVLQRKKSRSSSNPFVVESVQNSTTAKLLSSSILSTQDQIHQAVNKIILSGLRIRGLSTNLNHSVNEKLTIKEIYQMTYKSTMFSLRKHNYTFSGTSSSKGTNTSNSKSQIRLSELQDTIEKLLEIFVDVDGI